LAPSRPNIKKIPEYSNQRLRCGYSSNFLSYCNRCRQRYRCKLKNNTSTQLNSTRKILNREIIVAPSGTMRSWTNCGGVGGSFRGPYFFFFWIGHAILLGTRTDILLGPTLSLPHMLLAGKVQQRTTVSATGVIVKEIIGKEEYFGDE